MNDAALKLECPFCPCLFYDSESRRGRMTECPSCKHKWFAVEAEPVGEPAVIEGPPETWADFARRCQGQIGKSTQVFLCKQVGNDPNAHSFLMIFAQGKNRADLLEQVSDAIRAEMPDAP